MAELLDFNKKDNIADVRNYFKGGGEMGERTRNYDWTQTSLGPINTWPQSLITTVSIIISSKFPMFLFWGPDLLCFYNDAYRPSLGNDGKHPGALGQPAEQIWPEIWPVIKPLIDQVLSGGEATWSEDQLIPIYRNGKMEDVYWTFSYSPVIDESGKPGGVFVTCTETTETVLNLKQLEESNDQLQFAIEATELGTWDLDPITNKFRGNDRLKEWFGLKPEEEIELSLALAVMADTDRDNVIQNIQNALNYESGGLYDIIYTICNPLTKKDRIVRAKGRAWFTDEKVVYRFNGTLQDVTEQTLSQRKLKESEQRFQGAVSAIEGILWTNNSFGQMEGEQQGWASLTGQSFEEYQGYGWAKAVHPDDAQSSVEAWNEAVRERKTFKFRHRVKLKDGNWGQFSIRALPLFNADGNIREWVGVHTDITKRKEAEKSLELKNAQLLRINNDLDNFIYTASHDLKAPVSNIEGLLIALKESFESGEAASKEDTELLLHLMEKSINQFKTTILDLTEISKVQKIHEENITELDFSTILEDVKLSIADQIRESGAIVTSDFSKAESVKFTRKNLKSIIYNLLSNSIKYSNHERTPQIVIKTDQNEAYKILIITDNGLGISRENKDKMFSMFQRFHNHVEGTGVGLYIVKRIVDNAGGKIEVESEVGVGTTFRIHFLN